jgi:DNA-directed RNA polymerase specialized sigma24 family protein
LRPYDRLGHGEDVVQEALLKAIEALPETGSIAHPEAWLFRIAHNAARDGYRVDNHVWVLVALWKVRRLAAAACRSSVAGVEEAIQAVGASLRYLPKYSPDLNPIELVFHPLKTFLRKAAQRTIEGLNRYVGSYIRTLNQPWATSNILAMHHYDRDAL